MERLPMDGPNEPFITEDDEAKWQSMECDAMQCHDGLRVIQYENMRLENQLMQWEDQRSQEAMEARWYQQAAMDVDEEGEPAGPNQPGATTATDASTTEAPSSGPAAEPIVTTSTVSRRGTTSKSGPWGKFWQTYGKPYETAPWRKPERPPMPTKAKNSPMGTAPVPAASPTSAPEPQPVVASSAYPAAPSTAPGASSSSAPFARAAPMAAPPTIQKQTGWRAKMVYFLTMYERQDYQILDQLVNQMEGDVTSPPPDPKTWKRQGQPMDAGLESQGLGPDRPVPPMVP